MGTAKPRKPYPYATGIPVDRATGRRFVVRDKRDQNWLDNWIHLSAVMRQAGQGRLTRRLEHSSGLRRWLGHQREYHRRGSLDKDRRILLDRLGLDWAPAETAWKDLVAKLLRFRQSHGHVDVPCGWVQDRGLGYRVRHCREMMRSGRMDKSRAEQLARIGLRDGFAALREQAWQATYRRLLQFRKVHGHAAVPHRWREDPKLGTWVAKQRKFWRAGKLAPGHLKALKEAGLRAHPRDAFWRAMFARLRAYLSRRPIPPSRSAMSPELRKLGEWANRQRKARHRGRLSRERQEALARAGFNWQ